MASLYKRKLKLKGRKKSFFFDSSEISKKLPHEVQQSKKKKPKTYNCDTCPLNKKNYVPGLWVEGGTLWLGRDPGNKEVELGYPFCGRTGQLLRRISRSAGFRILTPDVDLTTSAAKMYSSVANIVNCRPPGDNFNKTSCKCCHDELEANLKQYKPKLIITLGKQATERILGSCGSMEAFNAIPVPSFKYNAIVFPLYHPSWVSRSFSKGIEDDYLKWLMKAKNFDNAIDAGFLNEFLNKRRLNYKTREITSIEQFHRVADLIRKAGIFGLDFENNTAKVYTEGSELYVGALATWVTVGKAKIRFPFGYWWKHSGYYGKFNEAERSEIEDILIDLATDNRLMKVVQNTKHEDHCLRQHIGCELEEPTWCTMVNKHILNSRKYICGLETQALQEFGINYKFKTDPKLEVKRGEKFNRIEEIPVEELGNRCSIDTVSALALYDKQKEAFREQRELTKTKNRRTKLEKDCIPFYNKGIRTFTKYEQRGINIDQELLLELKHKWTDKVTELEARIMKMGTVKRFAKAYTKPFNLNSKDQQRILLFDKNYFDLSPMEGKVTAKKKLPQIDQEVLTYLAEEEKNLFSRLLLQRGKFSKLLSTYILNIELYIGEDGRLHADFWLHTAGSYRSSSSRPNFQNFPKHYELADDVEAVELRSVFIPSYPDWELREVDYGGNEVRGLWMLCRDEQLFEDINGGLDMHRHFASKLYEISEDEVTKEQRFNAKNKFVFRTFYGGSAEAAATDMNLSPFLVQACQDDLYARYPRMRRWQDRVTDFYNANGYVELLMGFRAEGPLDREQIINIPIQGSSFHKVLHSCNEIEELEGFDTIAVNQVHDSILFDGPKNERDKHTEEVSNIMCSLPWDYSKGIMEEVEWQKGPNWKDMEEYATVRKVNQ